MAVSTQAQGTLRSSLPGPVSQLTDWILKNGRPPTISVPLSKGEIAHVEAAVQQLLTDFTHKTGDGREIHKSYLETALRTAFWLELKSEDSFLNVEWIIRFSTACVELDIVDACIPYILFHEACDWGDSREKEQIATLFVHLKEKWRSPKYSLVSCRNLLIRFTTELLSRLPKTSSARARGRLLCYVSARIPMSDKGAANTVGELNNGRCPTTDGLTTGLANNTHTNLKFAQLCNLLDYLKNPNLTLVDNGFSGFKTAFESVMDLMTPQEMTSSSSGDREEGEHVDDAARSSGIVTDGGEEGSPDSPRETRLKHVRFIPDPANIETDLKEDRIKRNILTRFLIVVQYIALPAKPKGSFEPTDEQLIWCDEAVQTALAVLSRTKPNGPGYVDRITDHLESEAAMSVWKDAGCPPLPSLPRADLSSLSPFPLEKVLPYARVTRQQQGRDRQVLRKSIRDLNMSGAGKTAGSAEVSKLLNRGPNTPEEFQVLGYQPPLLDFFIPVVEQAVDGAKLKDIYNDKFQWRALRILGKRTHIHFSNEPDKIDTKDIGIFLENYIMNLAERNPILQAAKAAHAAAHPPPTLTEAHANGTSNGNGNGETDVDGTNHPLLSDHIDELMDQDIPEENGAAVPDEPDAAGHSIFSKEQIRNIAGVIAGNWEHFAGILKFEADSIAWWKSTHTDPVEQAVQMLQVWMEALSDTVKDSNDDLGLFLAALKDNYNFDLA